MITIYTTPGCPKCALLKKKMSEQGLEYEESKDPTEPMKEGFKSAPVLKYNDKFYLFKDALELLKTVGA